MERAAFGIFVVLVLFASWLEFSRWGSRQYRDALTDSQKARRVIGALLLLCVGGMGFAGTYLPGPAAALPRLIQALEMLYWGGCLLLGLAIPVVAYLEAKETRHLLRAEHRRLQRGLIDPARDEGGHKTQSAKHDD